MKDLLERVRKIKRMLEGGPGSGNFGHAGRAGEVGGSGEGGGVVSKENDFSKVTDVDSLKTAFDTITRQLGGVDPSNTKDKEALQQIAVSLHKRITDLGGYKDTKLKINPELLKGLTRGQRVTRVAQYKRVANLVRPPARNLMMKRSWMGQLQRTIAQKVVRSREQGNTARASMLRQMLKTVQGTATLSPKTIGKEISKSLYKGVNTWKTRTSG